MIRERTGRGVIAILGPTNTGKTHLAIERMTAHESGLIGLPLRLLAREVYNRVAEKVGAANVALVTGEEKINISPNVRYQVCTVEAMPAHTDAAFVAIDEVQLAADMERGHIFTDRILNLRGRQETMLLGAETIKRLLQELLPGINIVTRPRMSVLTWAGQKKITRLPERSAVIAFSADEVYAIAELIRRQRGGAAVVLGSLSPRTRNAQVALYQSGDVDFLVATDAIGMGLNLDLDHVAFAHDRKFDGFSHRRLHPAEMGQIAGRAGRHMRDGTFGVTGQVPPFEDSLIQRLETHSFDPAKVLIWRNRELDTATIEALKASLDTPSTNPHLMKSFPASDRAALEYLAKDEDISNACLNETRVRLLWDVCQIPDYRRISPAEHASLLRRIFLDLSENGKIAEDWFDVQVKRTDNIEGDIDALSARIAHIRTWTYISNRVGWLSDPVHWQERTREIEDRLSDALHTSLTKRFIDRRTSVLMKRLRENAMLEADISVTGEITVEGHHIGRLLGFRFTALASASGPDAKAANGAAMKVLAAEITKRAERLHAAPNSDLTLSSGGMIRWRGEPVARLVAGETVLKPRIILLADEQLTGHHREMAVNRLERWLANHISGLLGPLVSLSADQTLPASARGLAFRIVENLGIIDRREIAAELQALDQEMRATLRRHGIRFGAYHVFLPALLKPAPVALICELWALTNDRLEAPGLEEIPRISAAGRTSIPVDPAFDVNFYRLGGFRPLGSKAVRIDILERLADLIRPAIAWHSDSNTKRPDGATKSSAFYVTPAMMSMLGATHDDMNNVLTSLGYRSHEVSLEEFEKIRPAGAPIPGANPAAATAAPKVEMPVDTVLPESTPQDRPEEAPQSRPQQPEETNNQIEAMSDTVQTGVTAKPEYTPKTVTLWRLAATEKRTRPHTGHGRVNRNTATETHKGKKPPSKGFANRKKGAKAGKPTFAKPVRPNDRPEKRVDPDSPFAKLMNLKSELEKRNS
jgi:ATP-dependent RNA helicase SUPV3L1/SUV3